VTEIASDAAPLAVEKRALRHRLQTARRSLAPSLVQARSEAAAARLVARAALGSARTVALYAAIDGELDPRFADAALRARGIRPVYPRIVTRKPPRLAFHAVDSLDALVRGPLGVPQPSADSAEVALAEIDAFVVPGLGFSASGARLGYGGGYYDATLASAPHALRLAYAHPEQLVSAVPESPRDQRVDEIIGPDRTLSCAPGRGAGFASGDLP